jgi:hypothetical protein
MPGYPAASVPQYRRQTPFRGLLVVSVIMIVLGSLVSFLAYVNSSTVEELFAGLAFVIMAVGGYISLTLCIIGARLTQRQ